MPATGSSQSGNEAPERLATNADLQRFIEEMFTCQQNMEAELAVTRAAIQQSDAE
jgi:hypothetical protein